MAEAKNKYGENHPSLADLKDKIAQAKSNLRKEVAANFQLDSVYQSLREKLSDYLTDLASYEAMKKAWSKVLARYEQEMLVLPPKQLRYARLSLEVTATSSVHQTLMEYQNKTSLGEFFDVQALRLVEAADVMSDDDSKPSLKLNTALGLILGVFFGLGAAFMVEYLDDSVKTSADLRGRGRGVYLGSLAGPARRRWWARWRRRAGEASHGEGRRRPWTAWLKPTPTPPEQAAAIIGQSLRLQAGGETPRRVLVTSAMGADGAAYLGGALARGLALALAAEGRGVVLVDAGLGGDERGEGGLHEDLGLKAEPGLAELMGGGVPAKDVLQATGVAGLRLLARGKGRVDHRHAHTHGPGHVHSHLHGHVQDDAKLHTLDAGAMRRLLEGLGEEDTLVVAAPPLLARASAMNLLGWAEAVVFCAEAARTSARDLDEALELAAAAPALKGLVLYQTEGTFWYRL
jgi:Mrp family chromosome partitioning ATPase